MAEKCKDFSNYGYPDERFETVLSENLHCAICSNVFKDPVMCKNEHCFCRACITEHLENSQNCPCCNHHLSVETLSDAPRILRNLLSELKIRCDYHERGCEEFVQLGNLASHVATCAKAPVVCGNEECSSEMSREDQARHENEECRFRKVKCRNCKEIDAMMQEIGANLGTLCENVTKLNTNVNEQLTEMKTGLTAVKNRFGEMEIRFEKVENRLDKMEIQFRNNAEDLRFGDGRRDEIHDKEPTSSDQATQADLTSDKKDAYIVAGGYGMHGDTLASVEIFDKTACTWRQLQSMKKCRADASSVVYKGQVLVTGGTTDGINILSSMEQLNENANPLVPPSWSVFLANLPRALRGHWSVVYNGRLLVFGGYDQEKGCYSRIIYEIQLHFPFNTRVLAEMPFTRPTRPGCGFAQVDDKIFVFGGSIVYPSTNVTMYDITKNEFKELAPLPYAVCKMATINFGENVILVGGSDGDENETRKKTVVSYNIKTQESTMLPPMKRTRSECAAVIDGDSIVVMGGINQHLTTQNSVQAFDFRTSQWRTLPPMKEARRGLVAEMV